MAATNVEGKGCCKGEEPELLDELKQHVGAHNAHLLAFWHELKAAERKELAEQILSINVRAAAKAFEASTHPAETQLELLKAVADDHHIVAALLPDDLKLKYWNLGLDAIARGEVAAIVLAGGQASRLGADVPKGVLKLHLGDGVAPGDSLLGLQAAKIARLEKLAKERNPDKSGRVQWLVMTSKSTEAPTRAHLAEVLPAVGLDAHEQLTVFSQAEIPAYDHEGRFLLADKHRVATAPDGNGGLYAALAPHLEKISDRGVKYVHVYCVDNILCRVADPSFIGYCIDVNADCAAKTVEKTDPRESVGVICVDDGRVRVVEYSELSDELSGRRTPSGAHLEFRAGSIANHFFTVEFLRGICSPDYRLPYHRADKKIAYVNENGEKVTPSRPNGVKLEQFVFDVFERSKNFHIWEVRRDDEFSPLKNADSAGKDCPSTCRADLARESTRWLRDAGAKIPTGKTLQLAAIRTYAGEGLDEFKDVVLDTEEVVGRSCSC